MVVMITEANMLDPHCVCQTCLLADRGGQPRWRGDRLQCGRSATQVDGDRGHRYECQMGFVIAKID